MARPRTHDPDAVLDAAEALAVEAGPAAVTVRALSELTSMSNGAIYHAFGSRAGLVGQVWLRAARRFLDLQSADVDALLGAPNADPADAVLAAAGTPARFVVEAPVSGQFLLAVSRSELLGAGDLPEELAAEMSALDARLTALFVRLATAMWARADRQAVEVIKDCVVQLPSALLLKGHRAADPVARERLSVAVRAILDLGPPARSP